MSVRAIGWAFRQTGIASSDKFVLVALADNANDAGRAWPATSTIARKTGLDRKTVVAALDRLETAGWIVDTGERKGRTKQIKMYRLRWANEQHQGCQKRDRLEGSQIGDTKDSQNPAEGSQIRDTKDSQKRETEPSGEPSENHKKNQPPAVPLSGDRKPDRIYDFAEAKRLICKLILIGKDPARPWSCEAMAALAKQLPIPLREIELVGWYRTYPDDPSVPELAARRTVTETGLCVYWGDEVSRANAFWLKTHPPEPVKKKKAAALARILALEIRARRALARTLRGSGRRSATRIRAGFRDVSESQPPEWVMAMKRLLWTGGVAAAA